MRLGIGLPTQLEGADGRCVLEWARRAELVKRFEDAGIEEVIPFPTVPDVDQVDRFADAVLA